MADALRAVLTRLAGDPLPRAVVEALESGGPQAALERAWAACESETRLTVLLIALCYGDDSPRRQTARRARRAAHRATMAVYRAAPFGAPGRDAAAVRALRAAVACPRVEDVLLATG